MKLTYVTTNPYKFEITQQMFKSAKFDDVTLVRSDIETPEIQADTAEQVATASAIWAADTLGGAVVVGDASLVISALGGFPGPYVKYMNSTLAPDDLLHLLANKPDRSAAFVDCLAFYDPTVMDQPQTFVSKTPGTLSNSIATNPGSTIDRLFIPDGWDKPLADIPKNDHMNIWDDGRWHRVIAFVTSITKDNK